MVSAAGALPGDAVLCAVGPRAAVAALLGEQRTVLGRELGLADPGVLSVLAGWWTSPCTNATPTRTPGTSPG